MRIWVAGEGGRTWKDLGEEEPYQNISHVFKKIYFQKKGRKKLKSIYIVELSKLINTRTFMNLTTLGEKKIKIYSKDFHE